MGRMVARHALPTPATGSLRMARGLVLALIVALLIGAAALRLVLFQAAPIVLADSSDYMRHAVAPMNEWRWWFGPRVVGVPLLYRLVGAEPVRIAWMQIAIAVACWSALALALAAWMRVLWLRPLVVALVLGFSLSADILQWDLIVMTESITTSLFALLAALWLWLLHTPVAQKQRRRWLWLLLGVVGVVWSWTRDANAYFLLALAGTMLLALLLPQVRRLPERVGYIALIGVFLASFAVQGWTSDGGQRWMYPLMNVIGKRILIDEQRIAFFQQHGMPVDDRLMRYRDQYAHNHGNGLDHDSKMLPFRTWMEHHGKQTYTAWLLSRPLHVIAEPWGKRDTMLRPPNGYYAEQSQIVFPQQLYDISAVLYPRPRPVDTLLWQIGALMALVLMLLGARQGRLGWLVPAFVLALVYPMMMLVWHADALEVGRHSHLIGVQLRLAGWITLVFGIEALLVAATRYYRKESPTHGKRTTTPNPGAAGT